MVSKLQYLILMEHNSFSPLNQLTDFAKRVSEIQQ